MFSGGGGSRASGVGGGGGEEEGLSYFLWEDVRCILKSILLIRILFGCLWASRRFVIGTNSCSGRCAPTYSVLLLI